MTLVDLRPGPEQLEAPHRLPVLGMYVSLAFSALEAAPRTRPRERDILGDHLDLYLTEPS